VLGAEENFQQCDISAVRHAAPEVFYGHCTTASSDVSSFVLTAVKLWKPDSDLFVKMPENNELNLKLHAHELLRLFGLFSRAIRRGAIYHCVWPGKETDCAMRI
jgi:hypothetical protein